MSIRIQSEDFNLSDELTQLRKKCPSAGAIVSFLGTVRDMDGSGKQAVFAMELEHYPEMTEKVLQKLEEEARQRWDILEVLIIHRVGKLKATDQIVLVIVCSKHRSAAFCACEYLMDMLKVKAPFWKKEETETGSHWVQAKASDDQASSKWLI